MKKQGIISLFVCVLFLVGVGAQMAVAKEKLVLWDVQTTTMIKEKIDDLRTQVTDLQWELEELKEKTKGCFRFGKPKKMEFPNYEDVDADI